MGMSREELASRRRSLDDALRDAFPNYALLQQLASHGLGISLEQYVAPPTVELKTVIHKLLEYVEANGLRDRLVRQARRQNRGNSRLREYERAYLAHFSTEELLALERAVEPLKVNTTRLLELASPDEPLRWHDVQPSFEPPPGGTPRATFSRIIEDLANEARRSSGVHPLHSFVARLIAEEPGALITRELEKWLKLTRGERALAQTAPITPDFDALYLFVKCDSGILEPVTPESDVTVTAWCWLIGADSRPVASPEKVSQDEHHKLKLKDVPEWLSELRKQRPLVKWLRSKRTSMMIEVCLRLEMLSEDIDGWFIRCGKNGLVPVGRKYPVVLRSFERLYDIDMEDTWEDWARKWEQLRQATGAKVWLELAPDMTEKELEEHFIQADELLCIVSCIRCKRELLETCLDQGAPAGLWLRKEGAEAPEARALLEPLLEEGPLSTLPERVYRARKRKLPLSDAIALLFDDYSRLPPDRDPESAFASPAKEVSP